MLHHREHRVRGEHGEMHNMTLFWFSLCSRCAFLRALRGKAFQARPAQELT